MSWSCWYPTGPTLRSPYNLIELCRVQLTRAAPLLPPDEQAACVVILGLIHAAEVEAGLWETGIPPA